MLHPTTLRFAPSARARLPRSFLLRLEGLQTRDRLSESRPGAARPPGPSRGSAAVTGVLFGLAWTFVLGVAAYDAYFAWQYRAAFDAWELNPMARWVAHLGGLGIVLGLKAGTIAFAEGLALYCYRCHHRLTLAYTACVSGVHLLLSLHYLASYSLWRG